MSKEFKFYKPTFDIRRCAFNEHYESAEIDVSDDKYLIEGLKSAKEAYISHYGKEFHTNKKHHGYFIVNCVIETNDYTCIAVVCDDKKFRVVRECDAEWLPHTKTIH